ncbi:MAG: DUF1698 domain-containing protein [Gammaproteobacteria bacterium]|nr:DUF1698 domain-containing protein [Gammaproteobacteria bacterium]
MTDQAQFEGHYAPWQMRRLMVIMHQLPPESIAGKNVIELGCGNAFFGEHFSRLGANVVCVDGRKQHLDAINARVSQAGNIHMLTRLQDLDSDFDNLGTYDYVLDLGLLYHLEQPERHIANVARLMHDDSVLILESLVCNFDGPYAVTVNESGYDQSLTDKARILSPCSVEAAMADSGLTFTDISSSRLTSAFHCYDWQLDRSGKLHDDNGLYFRKMWFARKAADADNPESATAQATQARLATLRSQLNDAQTELARQKTKYATLEAELDAARAENHALCEQHGQLTETLSRYSTSEREQALATIAQLVRRYRTQPFRLGLFGAGEHTHWLFENSELSVMQPRVLLDNDRAKWHLRYRDIPVTSPQTLNDWDLDVILVSSRHSERAISEQLRQSASPTLEIATLYGRY